MICGSILDRGKILSSCCKRQNWLGAHRFNGNCEFFGGYSSQSVEPPAGLPTVLTPVEVHLHSLLCLHSARSDTLRGGLQCLLLQSSIFCYSKILYWFIQINRNSEIWKSIRPNQQSDGITITKLAIKITSSLQLLSI